METSSVFWNPWSSVSEGSSITGGTVSAAILHNEDKCVIFIADPNGGVYTASGRNNDGWSIWSSVSEGRTVPGAPIIGLELLSKPGQFTLFLADPAGGVYTITGNARDGWGPWTSVSEGRTMPGAPLTAVPFGADKFALFAADVSGAVYTTSGNARDGWGPWTWVSQGRTTPGGHITAVQVDTDQCVLFVADTAGEVYTITGNARDGWGGWATVAGGCTQPGAPIAAAKNSSGDITLFLADLKGRIYATSSYKAPFESTTVRFANRFKSKSYINIESGRLTADQIGSGWLSAQWQIVPVSGEPYFRFQSVMKPDQYIHIENGTPEAGNIGPGWLSARWQFEDIPSTSFKRIRSCINVIRYAHIEGSYLDIGEVGPGWLSAQWQLEKVQGTPFVRIRNHWKADQCLHIEGGALSSGPIEPGWLSAQWSVETVSGTSYIRLKNRWKPDQYFHIENGKAEAGAIQPGWLSAQWLLESVDGTDFVRLRNRWELGRYLHTEGGFLDAGAIQPGWLSAQWIAGDINLVPVGELLERVVPLDLLRQKFDIAFNGRSQPLFQIRLNGKQFGESKLTLALDDPITRTYDHEKPFISKELAGPGEQFSADFDILGEHLIHFSDVKSDEIKLNLVVGPPLSVELFIHFETEGVELRVHGLSDIDFVKFTVTLEFEFGNKDGLIDLLAWMDDIDAAVKSINIQPGFSTPNNPETVVFVSYTFRGKSEGFSFTSVPGQDIGRIAFDTIIHTLAKNFINPVLSVHAGFPISDDRAADGIKDQLTDKIFAGLHDPANRKALNQQVTRWLAGGDFYVAGISSDSNSLFIDYILPSDQLEPFPEAAQSPLEQGLLANINHIVVLMMENRSFDHMLGHLSKEGHADGKVRPDVDGLHGGEKNPYLGQDIISYPLPDTQFLCNPPQDHRSVENQIDSGKMDGFVAEFARQAASDECAGLDAEPRIIMGYHTAAHVPVYDALAQEFLVCQRWFAAHPGPTFPNRFYTLTGRLNRDAFGNWEVDNVSGADLEPVATKTIFDHLNDQGVSWRYYEHGEYSFIRMFARYTTDNGNVISAGPDSINFVNDVLAGDLQPVTFIDPDFIDIPPGSDDEPPSNITDGQHFVGRVVDAVIHGPLWSKTLLIITYDEHGGFFDHVNPLKEKAVAVSGIDHYGVRVPAIIVSPWVKRGKVSNVVFDHTSIAKTIARRFMNAHPPDMGERMAAANDLSMVLNSTVRTDTPSIPVPPPAPHNAELSRLAEQRIIDNKGFKAALRAIRSKYSVPT